MSMKTRREISELHEAMTARVKKHHRDDTQTLLKGLELIGKELKTGEGLPSLKLRNLGRVMKHYLDLIKTDVEQVKQFNAAVDFVELGWDVQLAIRKARTAVQKQELSPA